WKNAPSFIISLGRSAPIAALLTEQRAGGSRASGCRVRQFYTRRPRRRNGANRGPAAGERGWSSSCQIAQRRVTNAASDRLHRGQEVGVAEAVPSRLVCEF